eukprot:883064-Prymnesium_polylepis.1
MACALATTRGCGTSEVLRRPVLACGAAWHARECARGRCWQVMEIPFFKRYQSWKAYYSWKRVIQSDKISTCRSVLTRHLFILNDTFQVSDRRLQNCRPRPPHGQAAANAPQLSNGA